MKTIMLAVAFAAFAASARAQAPDSSEYLQVLSAALGAVREEFPFGRVVVDRAVIDTTRRLAPPLFSRREHRATEDWARANRAEAADPESARPTCAAPPNDCSPSDIAAAIGFSDPVIRGDSARVTTRYSRYDGSAAAHLRTTVEILTLRKVDGRWKVQQRKLKAVG